MTTTVFPPWNKGFFWTPSTTAGAGGALPAGETDSTVTVAVRMDGDITHSPGNYSFSATAPAAQETMTPAQFQTAIGVTLPSGDYWVAFAQTDTLNGATATSGWTAEEPFSVPPVIVSPAPPAAFGVS